MKKSILFFGGLCIALTAAAQTKKAPVTTGKEKTAFQTSSAWRPEIDVRSDIAIVYGSNDRPGLTFEQRVKSWRDHGYITHFMTGIAWGEYQDYFLGKYDGKNHLGEGQVQMNGDTIWHGRNVPYIVPVPSYVEWFKNTIIKKVIDAGITSIYLEEPEFWARAGYSNSFKDEWQKFYGFPWRAQHLSPENTYLSSKLKYNLYYNAIKEVSIYGKAYGKSKGLHIKFYIPTHSLVNYSSWKIVSPEASLASLPSIDGYIAQVWTGTSREPTYYNGLPKERVFENAFLEYGSMVSMTAPTNRKVFFLTDPIEDWPRDWSDYKRNYEATFTAKLLYPMVADYEVMPWPERIYTRPYKIANSDSSILIPKYYSTQMQVMVNSLNDMPLSDNKVSGVSGIGVLMGNSLMFQRFPTHNGFEDPQFSNFYGQTMPLLKLGIPVQTVHMENLAFEKTLKDIKVLVMSYSNMKPMTADVHKHIAAWVKKGGVLIYCGRDDDPYQTVMEWWNIKGNNYKAPSEDLFRQLTIHPDSAHNEFKVGSGMVHIIRQNPKEFVMESHTADVYINAVKNAYENEAKAGKITYNNYLYLERGPYDIVSVMDESVGNKPYVVKGPVIDLFDPELPVLAEKKVYPGRQAYLYDMNRVADKQKAKVLASASRVYNEKWDKNSYSFTAKSPVKTINSMRVHLPAQAKAIVLTDDKGQKISAVVTSWDASSSTCYLKFDNSLDGINVNLTW
ncbi:hypothetical protein GCM10023149_05600 [Mucilaginibacter gynuensis]|uniref:Beta-galactosidase-like protein n=1 Tax=Mucilaginibacter gynuensis TaxID=1302236 RepID=A0ABP8FU68_9SPHI